MKTLLFSLAMLVMVPGVVYSASPQAQTMERQQLETQKEGLEIQHWQKKEERRQSWRQKYQQDMKRLIKRLQAAQPVG